MNLRLLSSVTFVLTAFACYAQEELTATEQEVFNAHKAELAMRSEIAGEDTYTEMCMKYHVPKSQSKKLAELLKLREKRKATYDYIYPSSTVNRTRAKMAVDSAFQDKIDAILIPFNDMSGENISLALRGRKAFKLDDAQYEYLMNNALSMCKRIRKDRRTDVWNEEMSILRKTLSKKQFESLLVEKNLHTVTIRTRAAWKKLHDEGLTEELDSVSDCARLYMHFMEEEKIRCVYRNFSTERKKRLAELDKGMPKIAKMYYALTKKESDDKKRKQQQESNKPKGIIW